MSGGRLVQFDYGEDGFDGTWMLRASMPSLDAKLDERPATTLDEARALQASRQARKDSALFLRSYKPDPRIPVDLEALLRQAKKASIDIDCQSFASRASRFESYMQSLSPLPHLTESILRCSINEEVLSSIDNVWFEWLLQEVATQIARGRAQPGESVGVLAAQSVAEQVLRLWARKTPTRLHATSY